MYSRNLRVEVTTKLNEKASQGYYPGRLWLDIKP